MEARKIWVLEDEISSQFVFQKILEGHFNLEFFSDLRDFENRISQLKEGEEPDALIADLSLGDGNFLTYLSNSENKARLTFPYFVVSSTGDEEVLRACFDFGAKDYLVKPFNKMELLVKVDRALNENSPKKREKMCVSNPVTLTVSVLGKGLAKLTAKEFQLFSVLYQSKPHTISRNKMISDVWGTVTVGAKTLDVHLFNLRRKIEPLGIFIDYFPKQGFKLREDYEKMIFTPAEV